MLTIRDEQVDVLSEGSRKRYQDGRVRHVREIFPEEFKKLGEEAVRSLVRDGMSRAFRHGITAERDVARFIDLMFLVSEDFDDAPDDSWLARTLRSDKLSGRVKMDRVWAWARTGVEQA